MSLAKQIAAVYGVVPPQGALEAAQRLIEQDRSVAYDIGYKQGFGEAKEAALKIGPQAFGVKKHG